VVPRVGLLQIHRMAGGAQDPPLDVEGGPAVQPGVPRRANYFLGCLPCALVLGLLAHAAGLLPLALLLLLVLAAYCCCACPLCGGLAYMWSWGWPVDLYTNILYLVLQSRVLACGASTLGPEVMSTSKLRPRRRLKKGHVDYALNLQVPFETEEEFGAPSGKLARVSQRAAKEMLARLSSMTDRFDAFKPSEDPMKYAMDRMGSVYPSIYQEWNDKLSDRALARFCLHGLGAHRLETEFVDGRRLFVVRCNALAGLPVRPGFARYGGDAYFDEGWNPVKIVDTGHNAEPRNDGTDEPVVSRPGDARWAEAKFRFRSSLSVLVTVVDHLYAIHLQTANFMVIAVRECLSPGHPMRRFLTPFIFQTISVNDNARTNLVQPKSMSRRCFAFTEHGQAMAFAAAPKLVRSGLEVRDTAGRHIISREEYVEHLRKQGIDTPYWRQSLQLWRIMRRFIVGYVEYYFDTQGDFVNDPEMQAMIRQYLHQIQVVVPGDVGPLPQDPAFISHEGDVEQFYKTYIDILAGFCLLVTAGHEQVGAVEAYVQDVSFCAFKWVPGALVGTKQTAIAQTLLMSFTSTPMPKLLGSDWTHLFEPRAKALQGRAGPREVFAQFQKELSDFSQEIDAYNASSSQRPFPENFPMYVLNPRLLETSISL